MTRLVLPSTRAEVDRAIARLLDVAHNGGFAAANVFGMRLALEEALSNALQHGNRLDPLRKIVLEYRFVPGGLVVEVEDEGEGFDLAAVPDPTAEENLEIPAGRGLILMRAYAAEVAYSDQGNRVRLRFSSSATS